MKLRPSSTLPLISKHEVVHKTEITREAYDHPWHQHVRKMDENKLHKPNKTSKAAIERDKYEDKNYHWSGSIRTGSKHGKSLIKYKIFLLKTKLNGLPTGCLGTTLIDVLKTAAHYISLIIWER